MGEVVIDASVAAKWQLSDESYVREAEALRTEVAAGRLALVVPAYWQFELASVLSKAVSLGRVDDAGAVEALEAFIGIPTAVVPMPSPHEAYRTARRFNRSVIDCFYLAIAEERGCDFWSDDRKLCRALSPTYPFVRWIGDYHPAPSPVE